MKHRIRINGEIKELDCQIGSGILDKNGREIFEGDLVRIFYSGAPEIYPVVFVDGVLWVNGAGKDIGDIVFDNIVEIVDD